MCCCFTSPITSRSDPATIPFPLIPSGKTYLSDCEALKAGVSIKHTGKCTEEDAAELVEKEGKKEEEEEAVAAAAPVSSTSTDM